MKTVKMIAISMLVSAAALAAFDVISEESETVSPDTFYMMPGGHMPMMYGQQGQTPMMRGQQGQMPMMQGQQGQMPMMQGQQGQMPMMYGQQGYMPMMYGQQGQMPMLQLMQQRHAVADEHMKKMEQHMANIEALLKQLVELQKK